MSVSVLIPAYNEEGSLSLTLEALTKMQGLEEILLVDDGSRDRTSLIACKWGVNLLRLPKNRGKGYALMSGLAYVSGDIIMFLDADLGFSVQEAVLLIEPLRAGTADMTIAKFKPGKSGKGFGLAKRTAQWGIKLLTRQDVCAPLSGQRAMWKDMVKDLLPFSPRFGLEVGMTIDALRKGYRILEVDTDMSHSPPGRNWAGFKHRGKQMYDICSTLTCRALR
ncbi:MAG: glycosyltransferase family 2 protein [Bacillota bacterium]|uniref:Glycosyltransferase n=1 Tax=Thermanaerosceptrum fracticalcis TaxID=1712410 RepID=A0A7G6E0F0_THEFR|nr:glycosyltransferase family 2 protein [Thermanaerosceptrum fracticalcis]QNB45554.1 glycosyltransferase [Thermanaerosceptrum fracticalcis]